MRKCRFVYLFDYLRKWVEGGGYIGVGGGGE